MADDSLKVYIEGRKYELDDFELGELEWLEDELGGLDHEHLVSMKAAVRFVTVIKRRENPEFSLDDARKLKISVFDDGGDAKTADGAGAKRPTRAPKGAASTRAASGGNS